MLYLAMLPGLGLAFFHSVRVCICVSIFVLFSLSSRCVMYGGRKLVRQSVGSYVDSIMGERKSRFIYPILRFPPFLSILF